MELTSTEFNLLLTLIESPDEVFTRERLYQLIWSDDAFIEDNAINVHVSNLRKKIAQFDDSTTYIETVWGIGSIVVSSSSSVPFFHQETQMFD